MGLKWQEGHGVLTLRKDELEKVSRYIDNQELHHGRGTLSALLDRTEDDVDISDNECAPPEEGLK